MKYLLDMDGVIADFVGGASVVFDVDLSQMDNWHIEKFMGLSEAEFWMIVNAQGPEFWENLPEYAWTDDLVRLLGENSFVISTAPSRSPDSAYGKIKWLHRKFGPKFNRYMLGRQKELMAKSGLVLIDDKEANVEKFRQAGGQAVLFPQMWNYNADRVDNRIGYVAEALGLRSTSLTLVG